MTKRKYTRLNEAQWAEAVGHYEAGSGTIKEISNQFGVSRQTMQNGLNKRGAVKGRTASEFAVEVAAKIASDHFGDVETHAERVADKRNRHLKLADSIQTKIASALDFDPCDPVAVMHARGRLQALDLGIKALERVYNAQARVMGIDDNEPSEEALPELVFRIVDDATIREQVEQEQRAMNLTKIDHADDDDVYYEHTPDGEVLEKRR